MSSFNKVVLMGNLTRDPEVKFTQGGTAVTELGLAVNRKWFNKSTNEKQEEVTFVDITVWGKAAENCGEYLSKGRACLVEGRLTLDQWDDRETGKKRSKLKVTAENVQFIGGGGNGSGQQQSRPAADPAESFYEPIDDGSNIPF